MGRRTKAQIEAARHEQMTQQIQERFDLMEDMVLAVKRGAIPSMVITGPAGIGKSHTLEKLLNKFMVPIKQDDGNYFNSVTIVKGAISGINLYGLLFEYRRPGQLIVFDDCDSVFWRPDCANVLKAVLDTTPKRMVSWMTQAPYLKQNGIPQQFNFKGSVIFCTNFIFDEVVRKKNFAHIMALESRTFFFDTTLTEENKIIWIRHLARESNLLKRFVYDEDPEIDKQKKEEMVNFLFQHKSALREISLRTLIKVSQLVVAFPDRWQDMARKTLMYNQDKL